LDKPGPFVNHPGVGLRGVDDEGHDRSRIAALLGYGELFLDAAVAVTLSVGGVVLFSVVVYDFVRHLGQGPVLRQVLDLLSGLLLVFIFTELISTVRVVIARRTVQAEPFLVVGIVAAIRRLIVISAEAEDLLGTPRFRDLVLEIAVLAGAVLVLGMTVLLLRLGRTGAAVPGPTETD
jgi:uncharacterized membrane protein (DUF373 family)